MGDRDIWQAIKENAKNKFDYDRKRFMDEAKAMDDGGWLKHTQWHWSRTIKGKRLDYWPSRRKWMYAGKVQRGNVQQFMRSLDA